MVSQFIIFFHFLNFYFDNILLIIINNYLIIENTNKDTTKNSSLQTTSNKLEDEFTLQYEDQKRNVPTQEIIKQICKSNLFIIEYIHYY